LVWCAAFAQPAPTPAEFEVAEVKANHSGLSGIQGGILPSGQISVRNIPMKELIIQAYKAVDIAEGQTGSIPNASILSPRHSPTHQRTLSGSCYKDSSRSVSSWRFTGSKG
jgi:hypothetical protein